MANDIELARRGKTLAPFELRTDVVQAVTAAISGKQFMLAFFPESVGVVGRKEVSIGGRARMGWLHSEPVLLPTWENLYGVK